MDAHQNRGGELAMQRLQHLIQSLYGPLGCVGQSGDVRANLGWPKPCSLDLHSPGGEPQELFRHCPQPERHTIHSVYVQE